MEHMDRISTDRTRNMRFDSDKDSDRNLQGDTFNRLELLASQDTEHHERVRVD